MTIAFIHIIQCDHARFNLKKGILYMSKRIKKLSEVSMTNKRVRDELIRNGMFLWKLAKLMGVSEASVTRMMREELPEDRQDELIDLIRKGANNGN